MTAMRAYSGVVQTGYVVGAAAMIGICAVTVVDFWRSSLIAGLAILLPAVALATFSIVRARNGVRRMRAMR